MNERLHHYSPTLSCSTNLPMQPSGVQMSRGAPWYPHPYSFIHMGNSSMNMIPQDQVVPSLSSQISELLMNRMAPENPKPYPFVNMDDPSMNLIPQNPADPTIWRKRQERTLFTHKQHEELEALFSHTMFPDKNLCMELALKFNVQESKVKVWFRNQRFKMRKQQQQHQQSLKKPRQITPAKKNVSTSPRASTNPYSFSPMVSDCYSSLPPQPLGASNWAQDSVFTWNPTSDVQMQEPQLESLVASVPALYSDAYDIAQIMELYSFPDEDMTSICSFSCLYQYLSPTRPQLERRGPALSIFADPAVGLSPGETWSSMTNTGFVADSLRDSLEFQNPSSMVDSRFQ